MGDTRSIMCYCCWDVHVLSISLDNFLCFDCESLLQQSGVTNDVFYLNRKHRTEQDIQKSCNPKYRDDESRQLTGEQHREQHGKTATRWHSREAQVKHDKQDGRRMGRIKDYIHTRNWQRCRQGLWAPWKVRPLRHGTIKQHSIQNIFWGPSRPPNLFGPCVVSRLCLQMNWHTGGNTNKDSRCKREPFTKTTQQAENKLKITVPKL